MRINSRQLINRCYPFQLLELEYSEDSFKSSFLTPEIFAYHRNKHHQGYINKLNTLLSLVENEHLKSMKLEEIVAYSRDNKANTVFNNAAQVWNHDFFWLCLSPNNEEKHKKSLWKLIIAQYESWENFVKMFVDTSVNHFASGWSWLVLCQGQLKIITTSNAEVPMNLQSGVSPIFTCDLWEHAYYLTFKNDRYKYVETMLQEFLNWKNLEENYEAAGQTNARLQENNT